MGQDKLGNRRGFNFNAFAWIKPRESSS
jgi:hypothetical protein